MGIGFGFHSKKITFERGILDPSNTFLHNISKDRTVAYELTGIARERMGKLTRASREAPRLEDVVKTRNLSISKERGMEIRGKFLERFTSSPRK